MLVRTTGIVTQLIFEHSLRIRIKAEIADTPANSVANTAVGTPDTASLADAEGSDGQENDNESPTNSNSDGDTMRASTVSVTASATAKGKQRAGSVSGESRKSVSNAASAEGEKSGNLVGKINNLVTTDLDNLINGRDFLFIGTCRSLGCLESMS